METMWGRIDVWLDFKQVSGSGERTHMRKDGKVPEAGIAENSKTGTNPSNQTTGY